MSLRERSVWEICMSGGITPEHRSRCRGGLFVHWLLGPAELHGRSRSFHYWSEPAAHRLTKVGVPGATLELQPEEPTIAELLKPFQFVAQFTMGNDVQDHIIGTFVLDSTSATNGLAVLLIIHLAQW